MRELGLRSTAVAVLCTIDRDHLLRALEIPALAEKYEQLARGKNLYDFCMNAARQKAALELRRRDHLCCTTGNAVLKRKWRNNTALTQRRVLCSCRVRSSAAVVRFPYQEEHTKQREKEKDLRCALLAVGCGCSMATAV